MTTTATVTSEQHEIRVTVRGREHVALLRTPKTLSDDPALLINLASDAHTTLDVPPYCTASNVFLAAGHRVASFDLPCHGAWRCKGGDQLVGIAAAIGAGEDPFTELSEVARAIIDASIEQHLARAGHIVSCGTSRGGLSALHVLAGDERVAAAAMFAPVTHLPAVKNEFGHLEGVETAKRASAAALVERVGGRSVAVAMNTDDSRVGSEHCLRFHAALRARWPLAEFPLRVFVRDTHSLPDAGYQFGAAFLLTHCSKAAAPS